MSEHLTMAKNSLNSAAEFLDSRGLEIAALRDHQQAIWSLLQFALDLHLESQKSPETPGSESISLTSGGASPETTTPSSASQSPQPGSATTAPISSASAPGQEWEGQVYHPLLYQPSKTQEPTRSTSETAQDIGQSASIGEVSHEQAQQALGNLIATCFRQRHGATFSIPVRDTDDDIILSRYIDQQASRSSSASAGGESEE